MYCKAVSYDVDSVLTTGKNEIQSSIREILTEQLEKHDIGLTLVNRVISMLTGLGQVYMN